MGSLQLGPGDKMVEERKKLTPSSAVLGEGDGSGGGKGGGGEGCEDAGGKGERERKGEKDGR